MKRLGILELGAAGSLVLLVFLISCCFVGCEVHWVRAGRPAEGFSWRCLDAGVGGGVIGIVFTDFSPGTSGAPIQPSNRPGLHARLGLRPVRWSEPGTYLWGFSMGGTSYTLSLF